MCDPAVDSEQFRQDLKAYLFQDCSPDIGSVSALEVLRNRAQQIDILLTYLLTLIRGEPQLWDCEMWPQKTTQAIVL